MTELQMKKREVGTVVRERVCAGRGAYQNNAAMIRGRVGRVPWVPSGVEGT